MRMEFQLDAEQRAFILKICASVPEDPDKHTVDDRERVGQAWDLLGKHMGFDGRTCEPVPGKDESYFTAEIVERKENPFG